MAAIRRNASNANTEQIEHKFSKEQLLASARYADKRDLVNALLDDKKKYTFEAVNEMIEKYQKGQVK